MLIQERQKAYLSDLVPLTNGVVSDLKFEMFSANGKKNFMSGRFVSSAYGLIQGNGGKGSI